MLVLTRKTNQSIMIGDEVEVSVLAVSRDKIRLGITAPREVPVFRKEVYLSIKGEDGDDDVEPETRERVETALGDPREGRLSGDRGNRGARLAHQPGQRLEHHDDDDDDGDREREEEDAEARPCRAARCAGCVRARDRAAARWRSCWRRFRSSAASCSKASSKSEMLCCILIAGNSGVKLSLAPHQRSPWTGVKLPNPFERSQSAQQRPRAPARAGRRDRPAERRAPRGWCWAGTAASGRSRRARAPH